MKNVDEIIGTNESTLEFVSDSTDEISNVQIKLNCDPNSSISAVTCRGVKCRTVKSFYNEIAASLQFPPYFGENLDALEECLVDLSWRPSKRNILFITSWNDLYEDELPQKKCELFDLLESVIQTWKFKSQRDDAEWFKVVCQGRL